MESDATATLAPPPLRPRPALARWMFERNLRTKDAVEPLGIGYEQVRRYCLPFDDELRVVPPPAVMRRIREWTGGAVSADSFYEPEPGSPADPEWTERRRQADAVADYPGLPDARP